MNSQGQKYYKRQLGDKFSPEGEINPEYQAAYEARRLQDKYSNPKYQQTAVNAGYFGDPWSPEAQKSAPEPPPIPIEEETYTTPPPVFEQYIPVPGIGGVTTPRPKDPPYFPGPSTGVAPPSYGGNAFNWGGVGSRAAGGNQFGPGDEEKQFNPMGSTSTRSGRYVPGIGGVR